VTATTRGVEWHEKRSGSGDPDPRSES
jgi:hypothetical protein